jgi:hypothetical protein
MRIIRPADAEVDIGLVDFGISGRSDGPDGLPFGNPVADGDGDRAQMREGDRPSIVGQDREGPAVRWE